MPPTPPTTTARRGRHRGRLFAAFASVAAFRFHGVRCLSTPRWRTAPAPAFRRGGSTLARPRARTSCPSSPTALRLARGGFDKFLQPYGISNRTHEREAEGDGPELLNALLPRLPTAEEKARILEGFQRARLHEQLRLSKLSKTNGGGEGDDGSKSDDDEDNDQVLAEGEKEVSRMTDLFQRARLAEQLRLSKVRADQEVKNGHKHKKGDEREEQRKLSDYDKYEAFQRALLEERLKIRLLQRRMEKFVSTSESIEKAMAEYEQERVEENKSLGTMTIVPETREVNETEEVDDNDSGEESEDMMNVVIMGGTTLPSDGTGRGLLSGGQQQRVNQSEVDDSLKRLVRLLEGLRQTVDAATASPYTRSFALARATTATSNLTSSVQRFLSTTLLPLPPREDASFLSLILAPLAHLLSCAFLMGAAGFYAVIALLDVLWNDREGEYSTWTCLKEASSVWASCWEYAVASAGTSKDWSSTVRCSATALQKSAIAAFLVVKCIIVRAVRSSRYGSECMDAGVGALRYFIYVLRSTNVLWARAVKSLARYFRNTQKKEILSPEAFREKRNGLQSWTRKRKNWKNPRYLFSNIKSTAARGWKQQRSLWVERQRSQSDESYTNKLRLLNFDRVALERDRQELREERDQLDSDRVRLTAEAVNVLAWYCAAKEAEEEAVKLKRRDGGWLGRLWGRKDGEQ